MATTSQRPERREGTLSPLNMAIDAMNLLKDLSDITPAKPVFATVAVVLTMIKDSIANDLDYVELGLLCVDVCSALDQGMKRRRSNRLSRSVRKAIDQLATTVAEIQENVNEKRKRNQFAKLFHARKDKEAITALRSRLNTILHIFNTELAINTHQLVVDIHQGAGRQRHSTRARIPPGELPPPPPTIFFGRDDLISRVIGLAENLKSVALVGVGGIGKSSLALTVLHHDRIKARFGDHRRFIRCDKFPASCPAFLRELSKVIGANAENPQDLTPLRPFLSSNKILIVLDNAESILDPQVPDSQWIYGVVEELSRFKNICLCVTSRITTIPPDCKRFDVPTLSADAAHSAFYRIYGSNGRRDVIDRILEQLDFHPLSITLLATVAHQSGWGVGRLESEWERFGTSVLQIGHNRSLATAIELSLASLTFRELGPDARALLGVVAFFPQGVDESNLDWLFPTIRNRRYILDKFSILSLTYRSNGFITMLAPLRDYLSPKDPGSSPLLCTTKQRYFSRLLVTIDENESSFRDAQWIISEDVNVEHLLNIFTSIDMNSDSVWDACASFMKHLSWHKRRLVSLGPKVEGLRDDHRSKPHCLYQLSRLFNSVGNQMERRRVLSHALRLYRGLGVHRKVTDTLLELADANRRMGFCKEGMQLAKEGLETSERAKDTSLQARCLFSLATFLEKDKQFDAAEGAVSRAIDLFSKQSNQYQVCRCHHALGNIYYSKGEQEKAIHHFNTALGIAIPFNWDNHLFLIHHSITLVYLDQARFNDAYIHLEQAKPYTINNTRRQGTAMHLQARIFYGQGRFKEARSGVLHSIRIFEGLGAAQDLEGSRILLQRIEKKMRIPAT